MWIDNISTFHTWTSSAENTALSSGNLKVTDHCLGSGSVWAGWISGREPEVQKVIVSFSVALKAPRSNVSICFCCCCCYCIFLLSFFFFICSEFCHTLK